MWENLKISLKDKHFRIKAIAILLVAFIVVSFVLWFSFTSDGYSVTGIDFYVRYQNGYGGLYYPTNASDGILCSTGTFYSFYHFQVQNDDGTDVTLDSQRYVTFDFDLSNLNLSYEYDITVFSTNARKLSFDGFLTTAHTFSSSSDLSVTAIRLRYADIIFRPSSVYVPTTTSSSLNYLSYTTSLNSNMSNGHLSLSLTPTIDNSSLSSSNFGFIISVAGTDFQQLLYRAGVTSTSDDYFQLLGDVSDALASGDITPDEAAIINDTATNTQSQHSINNITEAQAALDAVIQRFVNTSGQLIGPDLAAAFESYNDQLYSTIQTYMALITDPAEAAALSSLFDVASKTLESAYTQLVSTRFYNSVSATNQSFNQYHADEEYLLDNIRRINLSNTIQITAWADTLTSSEKTSFQTLLNSFLSNFSWSIFLQVPLYMTIIINLLGTSRSKEE